MIIAFALLDLLFVTVFILELITSIPWRLIVLASTYKFLKGWLFYPEIMSIIDAIIGFIFLLTIFIHLNNWIYIISLTYLIQKAIASLI